MIPWSLVRPLFFRMDAERAHELALKALANPTFRVLAAPRVSFPESAVRLWGMTFRNPVGLAAGFDKNAMALPAWERLGFGFAEVGTVTRLPQEGNPRPRIFRIPRHGALINRMGFPNEGPAAVRARILEARREHLSEGFRIGINLGKMKATPNKRAADDYVAVLRELHDVGDYFVVNISSPNTPGLRKLQSPEELDPILEALQEANRARARGGGAPKPLLVKIAPDLSESEVAGILRSTQVHELAGIVATNTTLDHAPYSSQQGGLSGRPLFERSLAMVKFISRETVGKLPIIAAGGVFDRGGYLAMREAGASLVQIYTGFVYGGPRTVSRLLNPA